MPQGHSFPLGRWLADQRRAFQAGAMVAERADDLDALGMVWEPGEVAWEENLSAARAYYAQKGTLAAPVAATALDKPVGQWLANCRKAGGWARTGSGRRGVRSSSRRSIRTGVRCGRWTGSATLPVWRVWW
nr:helicase associated domain-containing protein [Streptomyces californicus]